MLAGAHPDAGPPEKLALAKTAVRSLPAAGRSSCGSLADGPPLTTNASPRQAIHALIMHDRVFHLHPTGCGQRRPSGRAYRRLHAHWARISANH